MKNKFKKLAFRAFCMAMPIFLMAQIACCRKPPVLQEEMITTVKFNVKKTGAPDAIFMWQDLDGDGGNNPNRIDTLKFNAGSTYTVNLEFLNESNGQNENVTAEILAEAKNHLVCFTPGAGLNITITDSDGNFPLGLQSDWVTSSATQGNITVRLRHQPDVKNGTCDPGETDVEVTLPYLIK